MKKNHSLPPCTVQSVSYTPERRTMTFTSNAASATATPPTVKRRRPSFRLRIMMSPQAASSFEPVIKFRTPAKS